MNPKFLIIYSAFNSEEYVEKSLTPFLKHEDCYVVASSRKFGLFPQERTDLTVDLLQHLKLKYPNRFIGIDDSDTEVLRENHAKNAALDIYLNSGMEQGVDYIWIVDSDEFYTKEDIDAIINELKGAKNAVWATLPLKNFVFNKETYLEEPFCPPRIFRTSFELNWTNPKGQFIAHNFYWDNDLCYIRKEDLNNEDKIPAYKHSSFACLNIEKELVWIPHYSWLDDERSKNKVEYQEKHFGACSFKWENGHLEFNEKFYKDNGALIPNTIEKI